MEANDEETNDDDNSHLQSMKFSLTNKDNSHVTPVQMKFYQSQSMEGNPFRQPINYVPVLQREISSQHQKLRQTTHSP